jgi:hypothetical protein
VRPLMFPVLLTTCLLALSSLAGCDLFFNAFDDPPASNDDAGPDVEEVPLPSTLGAALCAAEERCDPIFSRRHVDAEECAASVNERFPFVTEAALAACAPVLVELSCDHFENENTSILPQDSFIPAIALWPQPERDACFDAFHTGERAVGDACMVFNECVTGLCDYGASGFGGTGDCSHCIERPEEGESCSGSYSNDTFFHECANGTICQNFRCIEPLRLGDACDGSLPCVAPASCLGEPAVCRFGTAGDPCDGEREVNYTERACAAGFACIWHDESEDFRCEVPALVADGEPCSGDVDCAAGSICWDNDVDVSTYERRCHPGSRDGESCRELVNNGYSQTSKFCAEGFSCGSDGVCHAGGNVSPPCEEDGTACAFDEICDTDSHLCVKEEDIDFGTGCLVPEDCLAFFCGPEHTCVHRFSTDEYCIGTGIPALLDVESTTCDAGVIVTGQATECQIVVKNPNQNSPVSITGLSFTRTTPSSFSITSETTATTVVADGTLTVTISIDPSALGIVTGGLIVTTDGAEHPPLVVPMSADVVEPVPVPHARVARLNDVDVPVDQAPVFRPGDDIVVTGIDSTPSPEAATVTSYHWEFVEPDWDAACAPSCDKPTSSTAAITTPDAPETGFTSGGAVPGLDLPGIYRVRLRVSDDRGLSSTADVVLALDLSLRDVQVVLTWDTADGDLDLHLVPTASNFCVASPDGDCMYSNRTTSWGATLVNDDAGFGPEEIAAAQLDDGDYKIGVDTYFATAPTTATIRVFVRGELTTTVTHVLTDGQSWLVGTLHWTSPAGDVDIADSVETQGICGP